MHESWESCVLICMQSGRRLPGCVQVCVQCDVWDACMCDYVRVCMRGEGTIVGGHCQTQTGSIGCMEQGVGNKAWGARRMHGAGCRTAGCKVQGVGARCRTVGCRARSIGCRVWGLGW